MEVSNHHLSWEDWYRDGSDGSSPINVDNGQNIMALGIRVAAETATGYQCTWKDKTVVGKPTLGNITLEIDVPYSANNNCKLDCAGPYNCEGWTGIGKSGHQFIRSITLTEKGGKLMASKNSVNYLDDIAYTTYLDSITQNLFCLKNTITLYIRCH